MTDDINALHLLGDSHADAIPCGHILRFIAYLAANPEVRIVSGEDDDVAPAIDCQLCEVIISFEQLGRLVMREMAGRN